MMDLEDLELIKELKIKPIFSEEQVGDQVVKYKSEEVKRLLPHRKPFLFIDQINKINISSMKIEGQFFLDSKWDIFTGHFPGDPVFPGVLQVEMMGQLGLCLSTLLFNRSKAIETISQPVKAVATRVRDAAFYKRVLPDQVVYAQVQLQDQSEFSGVMAGQLFNQKQELCSLSIMEVFYVE